MIENACLWLRFEVGNPDGEPQRNVCVKYMGGTGVGGSVWTGAN